jgi:hypothetical protein
MTGNTPLYLTLVLSAVSLFGAGAILARYISQALDDDEDIMMRI